MKTNIELAKAVLNRLYQEGVHQICICPGSRNAPFIEILEKNPKTFNIITHFEEREAAFFCLHQSMSLHQKTCLITTSGTAAAECLPAVIEAYYQSYPLIIINADRPKYFRGSGSPQSIDQNHIFGSYAVNYDLDNNITNDLEDLSIDITKPIHLNVCFDEPLIDADIPDLQTKRVYKDSDAIYSVEEVEVDFKKPLYIVGEIKSRSERNYILDKINTYPAPTILEPLSGIQAKDLKAPVFWGGEKYVHHLMQEGHFDGVIRIGGVPSCKMWRRLEKEFSEIPVYSFNRFKFKGIARDSHTYTSYNFTFKDKPSMANMKSENKEFISAVHDLLDKYPQSEPSFIRQISYKVAKDDSLYLGNSLPIRLWHYFANHNCPLRLGGNRGANGIDGQIASFIGFSEGSKRNIGIFGDLTALYGLSAFGLAQKFKNTSFQFVIMNNLGGRIFERMYSSKLYLEEHKHHFDKIAEFYNLGYERIEKLEDIGFPIGNSIIELLPDNEETKKFWDEYDKLHV